MMHERNAFTRLQTKQTPRSQSHLIFEFMFVYHQQQANIPLYCIINHTDGERKLWSRIRNPQPPNVSNILVKYQIYRLVLGRQQATIYILSTLWLRLDFHTVNSLRALKSEGTTKAPDIRWTLDEQVLNYSYYTLSSIKAFEYIHATNKKGKGLELSPFQ